MSVQQAAQRIAADASEALGPESGLFARADKADFGKSVLSVLGRAATHPADVGTASLRFGAALARSWPIAITRWLGSGAEPPRPADAGDKRFTDATWRDNPAYFGLQQAYLAARRMSDDLLAAGKGNPVADQKAKLALGLVLDALAPTNFLPTNPAALKRAFETGGASVLAGARNFLGDVPTGVTVTSLAGGFTVTATIPAPVAAGPHRLIAVATDGERASAPITVR